MKLQKGFVLLLLSSTEKKKLFEQELFRPDGSKSTLFKDIEQGSDMGGSYAQTVQSAEVIAVADDVKHIIPGDIAILDYIVDTLQSNVVYQDDRGKLVCVDTRTIYHEEDHMTYGNLKSRQDVYVWRKGDVDEASLIYGVFRGERLIPNPPYIICEHKEYQLTSKNGVTHMDYEEGLRIRKVLVPNELSDEELKPGTYVVVEDFCLYERELDGKKLDVIMDQDIEVAFE